MTEHTVSTGSPTHASTASSDVSVIVPAHQDSEAFRACLAALGRCDPGPDELIVVVDGADPETVRRAHGTADRVIEVPEAGGPAKARNAGAAVADGDVLFFVDSDVEVAPDTIGRLREAFADEAVDAVIGSYDDDPPAPGFASQYKNLLNHHVHQTTAADASTFWGACGAVRKPVFDAVQGFDERYSRPCIEDIELGYRMRSEGAHIEVVRDLQVTHLKRWTLGSMVRADIVDRAAPWSELILDGQGFSDELNISRAQRAKAAIACGASAAFVVAAMSGPRGGDADPRRRAVRRSASTAVLLGVGSLAVLDRDLIRFFHHRRGVTFALAAGALHWVTYCYSAATFAAVAGRRLLAAVTPAGRQGRVGGPSAPR